MRGSLRPTLLHRRPAQFLQALVAFVPCLGVENADDREFVHFETRDYFGPQHDPLWIGAIEMPYLQMQTPIRMP